MGKPRRFWITHILCLVCLILLQITPAGAQTEAARMQGVVTDSTGALVPGAKVKVTDVGTNRVLEATTGGTTGAWSFPSLPPGNYDLEISSPGFKTIKQ